MTIDIGTITTLSCITVHLEGERIIFHSIILKKSKGEISLGKTKKSMLTVKELVKEIGTRHPVLLHFSGRGILNRKIRREENYRHSILLNARLDDFYFTDYLQDKEVFSSVIRKNVVEEVHSEFSRQKLHVIGISSGPFITVPFAGFFDKPAYVVDDMILLVEKGKVVTFEKAEHPIGHVMLGADRLDSELLGAVTLGAQFFNPSDQLMLSDKEPGFLVNLLEAKQKNIFFRFGMAMMLFFLFLLTSNYLYLGHINAQIGVNYGVLAGYEDQLADLTALEEEKNRKENLLRSSGLLSNRFLSFYLAEISNTVPRDISFHSLTVRPLVNEIKKKQKIEFYDRLIRLSGKSKSSEILSQWIEELKQEDWLSKVDILEYSYEKNAGNFELELIVF
jgi:hypothetical protein